MCNITYIERFVNAGFALNCRILPNPKNNFTRGIVHRTNIFDIFRIYIVKLNGDGRGPMQDDIFNLLMMILMLENGGGTESINQLVLMFLLMNSQNSSRTNNSRCCNDCGRADGFTF